MGQHRLTGHELVVHAFAPVDGPFAARAHRQLHDLWVACGDLDGRTAPVTGLDLPVDTPPDWLTGPESRPLAARQRPSGEDQAILRRDRDVLNLSALFAPASGSPVDWQRFDRRWDEVVAAAGTDALLGLTRIYQTTLDPPPDDVLGADVARIIEAAVPDVECDEGWWRRGAFIGDAFHMWELSLPRDTRTERRLVVVAAAGQGSLPSTFTWGRGDAAMPPLARYLMHAARLRYQFRVWAGGQRHVGHVRQQLAGQVDRVNESMQAAAHADHALRSTQIELAQLRADLGAAIVVTASMREMRRAVEIAADSMTRAVEGQVGKAATRNLVADDRAFAGWFTGQLDDVVALLRITQRSAKDLLDTVSGTVSRINPARAGGPLRTDSSGPTAIRLGFTFDVVAYGLRTAPEKAEVQRRLARLVVDVLRDMSLRPDDTSHQAGGDSINVFLPADVEIQRALPRLVRSTAEWLTADNRRHRDQLRLRMGVAVGPVELTALGFGNSTIVECTRLVNSEPLRAAMSTYPDANLAVLISHTLYTFVVAEGHPGIDPSRLRQVAVYVKEYRATAWLWVPSLG